MSILGIILVVIGSLLLLINWISFIDCWRKKKGSPGIFPFPSILIFGGSLMLPSLKPFGWLAFVIDYSFLGFLYVLPREIRNEWQLSRFTRVRELRASDPPRLFVLTLHRRGHFYIKLTCDPPMGGNERGTGLASSGIMGQWEAIDNGFLLREYRDQRTLQLHQSGTSYVATEDNYPQDKRYPVDSMNGLTFTAV